MTEITTAEAARRLGTSARRIQQLAATGALPVRVRVGRAMLFAPSDVERLRRRPGPGRPKS